MPSGSCWRVWRRFARPGRRGRRARHAPGWPPWPARTRRRRPWPAWRPPPGRETGSGAGLGLGGRLARRGLARSRGGGAGRPGARLGRLLAGGDGLGRGGAGLADMLLGQTQGLLDVGLQLGEVVAGFQVARLQRLQQQLELLDARARLGLGGGLAGRRGAVEALAGRLELLLGLAALLAQLEQPLLGVGLGLDTGFLQMVEQAARQLLKQVKRSEERRVGDGTTASQWD